MDVKKIFLSAILLSLLSGFGGTIYSDNERITAQEKIPQSEFTAEKWRTSTPGLLKIYPDRINGGVVLDFTLEHGGINRKRFPYVYGENPTLNSATLPVKVTREIAEKYNQFSCMIYPDVPDRASVWIDLSGSGIWTQACYPLIPRKWNKVSVCFSNHPDAAAAMKLNKLTIMRQNYGRLPGDPLRAKYYIKDPVWEKVASGSENSWAASAEKVIVPQNGFAPQYTKQAIISGTSAVNGFEVIDRNAVVVYKGKVEKRKFATGEFKIADFSALTRPGVYRVRCGSVVSVPFEISAGHQKELAKKNRFFLYCMRSGMKTPAHPECFLEPCMRSDNGKPMDIAGGWFDASDLRGYHSMAIKTILRPLALAHEFNTPALADEARWGALLLTKLFDPETNLPVTVHALYPQHDPDKRLATVFSDGNYRKVNNYWTDNIPDSGDERGVHVARGTFSCHPDLIDSHWGLTAAGIHFFRGASESDRELAAKIFDQCKRHFDFLYDHTPDELYRQGIGGFDRKSNIALALQLENAVTIFQASGKTFYREVARQLAAEFLARQERRLYRNEYGFMTGLFCSSTARTGAQITRDDYSIYALCRLAEVLKGEEISYRIHAALRIYADFYLKNPATRTLPYQAPWAVYSNSPLAGRFSALIGEAADGRKLYGALDTYFMSGVNGTAAMMTQVLAVYLNDPQLQEIAAQYLTFHTGFNPSGRSYIAEVGTNCRKDIMSSALGWIPGMMSNPNIVKGVPGMPYNRHHGTNEIYTQTQAAYAVTAEMINQPARWEIRVLNAPAELRYSLDNGKTRQIVPDKWVMQLAGGQKYRIVFSNGCVFEGIAVSGEKRIIEVDMKNFLQIRQISMPEKITAGKKFTITVSAAYFGGKEFETTFAVRGENLRIVSKPGKVKAVPGKSIELKFEAVAMRPEEAAVFMIHAAGQPEKLFSRSAAVVKK